MNYDVLLNILDHSGNQPDFCRLMRTCRTLYEAGVPRLLRRVGGRISIHTRRNLYSFCAFMLRKNPSRFQHLLELDIHLERPFYKDARANNAVALMFKNASQLATLKLPNPDYLLADKVVHRAVASLSSVREVVLRDVTDEVVSLLDSLKAPVRKVNIAFDPHWAEDGGDPIPLLKNFAGSLEELSASWVTFETLDVQYPHLVDLHLDICVGFDFKTLYRAFPNLRHLRLFTGIEHDWMDMRVDWRRQRNLQAQAELGTWQSLSYVRTSVATLYSLALQCRVDHLDMGQSPLVPEVCEWLGAVLSEVQPLAISLSMSAKEFDTSLLGATLRPSMHTLHELFLDIKPGGGKYVDPSPTLVRFIWRYVTYLLI